MLFSLENLRFFVLNIKNIKQENESLNYSH